MESSDLSHLASRDSLSTIQTAHTTRALLIALLVLGLVALVLALSLYIMRQMRKKRQDTEHGDLPKYEPKCRPLSKDGSFAVSTTAGYKHEALIFAQEKESLVLDSPSMPASPIPEIRITFPEEMDQAGKRQSGRVVVVRVGEHNSVGLEPLHEDLPPYQQCDLDRFQSLDLDRIGGLKEKERR